jgi:hypothetical protein
MSQMTKKEMLQQEIEKVKDKLTPDEIYRFAVISSYATRPIGKEGEGIYLTYIDIANLIKETTGQEVNFDDIQMSNERL